MRRPFFSVSHHDAPPTHPPHHPPNHPPILPQFRTLLSKFMRLYWRTPSYNLTRCAMTVVVSLIYGGTYWGAARFSDPASIGSVQNALGVLYSASNFLGMSNLMSVMPVISECFFGWCVVVF